MIKRQHYIVTKKSKGDKLVVAYESEFRHRAEDYVREHGGHILETTVFDDDGLIVPEPSTEPVIENYATHQGPVPRPPGTYAPYGISLEDVPAPTITQDPETGERTIHLPERLLRDVLDALENTDGVD